MKKRKMIIFGAGGHARVVADSAISTEIWDVVAFVDRNDSASIWGIPVISEGKWQELNVTTGIVAVGDNSLREKIVGSVKQSCPDFEFVSVIDKTAMIGHAVEIGRGSYISKGAVVQNSVKIFDHTVINSAASVDHDTVIEDFASVGPGATLGGAVHLERGVIVAIGATVLHGINLGKNCLLAAGGVAIGDIPELQVFAGVPATFKKERTASESYL